MTDIVERLRAGNLVLLPILAEAADEIERLRAALATCRELREYDAAKILRLGAGRYDE